MREPLALLANPFTAAQFQRLPQEKKDAAATAVRGILVRLEEHKQEYIRLTGDAPWVFARQHALILAQNIEMETSSSRSPRRYLLRDRSMAENIQWILKEEGPGTKMVAWAHNGHVAVGARSMGSHLREALGADLVAFGFAFNQGSFQARDFDTGKLREFTVSPAPEGSLDAALAATKFPLMALNLRALPKDGPVTEWFASPHGTRLIGAGFSEQSADSFLVTEVAARRYDALLFVERTTAARPLEGSRRRAEPVLAAPANLDFESGEPGKLPSSWSVGVGQANFDFTVETSEEHPRSGRRCAVIRRGSGRHYGEMYGSLFQRVAAVPYRGSKLRLRAAVRTDVAGPGNQAHLWLRIMRKGSGPVAEVFYDGMGDRPITAPEWRDYEIVADVPPEAEQIEYGLALVGEGRAWLDEVSLETVPRS